MQVLDDSSGNSFIENPLAPDVDPLLSVDHYNRTSEQEVQLGIISNSTEKQVQRRLQDLRIFEGVIMERTSCKPLNILFHLCLSMVGVICTPIVLICLLFHIIILALQS